MPDEDTLKTRRITALGGCGGLGVDLGSRLGRRGRWGF